MMNHNNVDDTGSNRLDESDNSFSGQRMSRPENSNSSSTFGSLGFWNKKKKSDDSWKEDEDMVHDLQVGDHVIRWSHVALYPIQIHGIVLETSPHQVCIVDFGYTRQQQQKPENNNQQEEGSMELEDRKQAKSSNRFHIRTLCQSSEIEKWHKINYGDERSTVNKNENAVITWAKSILSSNTQKPSLTSSQTNHGNIEMATITPLAKKQSTATNSQEENEKKHDKNQTNIHSEPNNIVPISTSEKVLSKQTNLEVEENENDQNNPSNDNDNNDKNYDGNTKIIEATDKTLDQLIHNTENNMRKQQPTMYVKPISSGHTAISNYDIGKQKKKNVNPYSFEGNARIANAAKNSAQLAWSSASPWLQKAKEMTTVAATNAAQPIQRKFFPSNNDKSPPNADSQNNIDINHKQKPTSNLPNNSESDEKLSKDQQPKVPKSDPKLLVLSRVAFLLESEQKDLDNKSNKQIQNEDEDNDSTIVPPYHAFLSNSECIAVWCKTGRWSTFQASVFLYSTAIGNGKQMMLGLASAAAVSPMLIPVAAGFGAIYVGAPYLYLNKCKSEWEKITQEMNDKFWAQAHPELFVGLIKYSIAQKKSIKGEIRCDKT